MDLALRLHRGQKELTPEQEAEARRFAAECIRVQLSTEPVNEPETEALLRQAYHVAELPPPQRISWLDGPFQLATMPVSLSVWDSVLGRVWDRVRERVDRSIGDRLRHILWPSVGDCVAHSAHRFWFGIRDSVLESVEDSLWESSIGDQVEFRVLDSIRAYHLAPYLADGQFFDVYLAPNDLHALARFNERVSGYWLSQEQAILVRRPRLLARDDEGRLHCATGKCLEYPDGWGGYAWHGVRVPEHIILAPERLTREDFLNERDVEVRRVIQERMGSRFVGELGGALLDEGPRGTLYEVRLPEDDPEGTARYVQVQDASTERQYMLRVPPTVETAAEAVAWSFHRAVQEYHPAQET